MTYKLKQYCCSRKFEDSSWANVNVFMRNQKRQQKTYPKNMPCSVQSEDSLQRNQQNKYKQLDQGCKC